MSRVDYDSKIPAFISRMDEAIEEAARLSAEAIAADAKSRVPVDSGDLKNAIHVEKESNGYAVVAGNEDITYGHVVENGRAKPPYPPRPFLIPAAEREKVHINENGRRELDKIH